MQPTTVLQRSIRRLALTTKQVNGGYYKGTRSGSMGRHTKHGGYIIDWKKVRTYVVPDLEEFKLTPFVTRRMEPTSGALRYAGTSPLSGRLYLERWKAMDGES
ncbi:60S ribosomal protein L27, mitochondrial [Maublancomyces gigas]|uniref:60S ribosomal protein L27, mitochondrial n=1 Tax=Discina gigas TaxID=1032678 RepID=A0ABR3GT09_9PEZI